MELPENNIEYDETKSPRNNKLLIFGLFIALAVIFVLPVAYLLTKINQIKPANSDYQAQTAATPATVVVPVNKAVLAFNPQSLSLSQNSAQSLNLLIDTSTFQATAAEIYFKFDPAFLEIQGISPAGFFDQPQILQKKIDNETGKVSLAIATFSPKSGNGNFLTLNLLAKNKPGTTEISVTPNSKMTGKGEADNILGETKIANIEIK